MENLLHRDHKISREVIVSDYGRNRLLTYADSFLELSGLLPGKDAEETKNRRERLEDIQAKENIRVLSDNMREVAGILSKIASEVFTVRQLPPGTYKRLVKAFRLEKIIVQDIFYYSQGNNMDRMGLCLKGYTKNKRGYGITELADMLSVLLNRRLEPSVNDNYRMDGETAHFFFVEQPCYHVLSGHAKAVKEGENVSGDSFSILERDPGQVTILLSDGMGSGIKAGRESGQVVELMEYFLEAGYGLSTALNLVNSTLLCAGPEKNMSTLDVCSLDLYTGMCEFWKAGGASSYIKSGRYVEEIDTKTLPLGIFGNTDAECVIKAISGGDYVILLTDGIRNALVEHGNEQLLRCYISEMQEENPTQMARMIMQFAIHACQGRVGDDMLVVVLGVFEQMP